MPYYRSLVKISSLFFCLFSFTEPASVLRTIDICAGATKVISCASESSFHTVLVANAFYGIQTGAKCQYSTGDCTQEFALYKCNSAENTCSVSALVTKTLSECEGKRANYYHIEYYCVPCKILAFLQFSSKGK